MKSREELGRLVREVWIEWAKEQPNPKPSWLVPWEDLSEPDREVDRRIGERLAAEPTFDQAATIAAFRVRAEKAEAALNEARHTVLFRAGARGGPHAWRWPFDPLGTFLSDDEAWARVIIDMPGFIQ